MTEVRERVVVGVDGSPCSHEAVRWARKYAETVDATLVLVIAWHWPVSYGVPIGYDGFDPKADAGKIVDETARALALPREQYEEMVLEGPAGDVLVEAAKDASLLVVGTRGHGAVASTLLGSTSTHCARHAACPVVIVR